MKSHSVNITTEIILSNNISLTSCHVCESWTLRKADDDRFRAFEIKGLRQILRVAWTERKSNEWVLQSAGTNISRQSESTIWAYYDERGSLHAEGYY